MKISLIKNISVPKDKIKIEIDDNNEFDIDEDQLKDIENPMLRQSMSNLMNFKK